MYVTRLSADSKHERYAKNVSKIQLALSRIQLPKTGTISGINDDGTYQQGPIPGLGGSFETAAKSFKAWSTKADFGSLPSQIQLAAGPYAEEVTASASHFMSMIHDLADGLSICNEDPFSIMPR